MSVDESWRGLFLIELRWKVEELSLGGNANLCWLEEVLRGAREDFLYRKTPLMKSIEQVNLLNIN
jgi:hypothetical protein